MVGIEFMLCPVCDTEMLILEFNKIEIDFCTLCGGVWLDEGELELLISPENGNPSSSSGIISDLKKSTVAGAARKCPVCRKKMLPVELSIKPPVEIDKCPLNHGLWFDKGELEQIMTSSGASGKVSDFLRSVFRNKPE
jgi:Zn-finger nucleic acid-binding protein